jgi:hypothetical protein
MLINILPWMKINKSQKSDKCWLIHKVIFVDNQTEMHTQKLKRTHISHFAIYTFGNGFNAFVTLPGSSSLRRC